MLEILKAVLFGVVEGITEWLPISSTGHMILLNEFVKLNVSSQFWDMFLVVIQFGAILAVILLYWKTIWPLGIYRHRKRTRIVRLKDREKRGKNASFFSFGYRAFFNWGRSKVKKVYVLYLKS